MIEAIRRPPGNDDLDQLAALLVDAVESGASVSFMSPFSEREAREWSRTTLAQAPRVRSCSSHAMSAASSAAFQCIPPCDTVVFYKKL